MIKIKIAIYKIWRWAVLTCWVLSYIRVSYNKTWSCIAFFKDYNWLQIQILTSYFFLQNLHVLLHKKFFL